MTTVAAVIRLSYARRPDDPEWCWRLEHFRSEVMPRLCAQTTPCDVWVWVNPRHQAQVAALGLQTFTVVEPNPNRRPLPSRFPWSAVHGLPRYPVQLLLGSDDYLGPEFVKTALEYLEPLRARRALVTFQPWKLDLGSRVLYDMRRYRTDRPSPFCALRQDPSDPRYTWVWARGHTGLGRMVGLDAVRVVPTGHCALVVHRYNDSTTVVPQDVPTSERPAWL